MLTNEEKEFFKSKSQGELNRLLSEYGYNGNLELFKYVLLSQELPFRAELSYDNYRAFHNACRNNHLNIIQPLLLSKFKKEINQEIINIGFNVAATWDSLDIVKYLLTSPGLDIHANIHFSAKTNENDDAIKIACRSGDLELVKYLLTVPELKEHANIHAGSDYAFTQAVIANRDDVVNYLIFDYKIEKTTAIIDFIEHEPEVKKLFELRDLNDKLNEELKVNQIIKNKYKV